VMAQNTCIGNGPGTDVNFDVQLPTTRTYTLLITPGNTTGSLTLTLSGTIATGSITINDPSISVSIARPEQNARLIFSSTAGQWIDLGVTNINFSGSGCLVSVWLIRPNGSVLTQNTCLGNGAGTDNNFDMQLPDTGIYTVRVDSNIFTGTLTLTL